MEKQDMNVPFVSIVIPTYNRSNMIEITLKSFVEQNYPGDRFEIIVCNNNSTDNSADILQKWEENYPRKIRIIFEPRQGVHYARNTAAHMTKGDILYYTDDDMIADPNLLVEIVKPFQQDEKVATATGKVLPRWEVTPPDWIPSILNIKNKGHNGIWSLQDRGEGMEISATDIGVYSCHQAIRRDYFFQSGGFNPENTAGEWIGDGETGLNIKISQLGGYFAYNGKAVIQHMIPPARLTQEYLNKRMANQGNCDSYTYYREHRPDTNQLVQIILGYQNKLYSETGKYIRSRLQNNPIWHVEKAQIHYFLARIEYDYRLMSDPEWRELVLRRDWLNSA
jgi:glycosyltransferase involved in cell wall biosynthesis